MNFNAAVCTPISGDHILAADLSRTIPEFAEVSPDAVIGYAPVPGIRRVLRAVELRRVAAKFNVRLESDREACFEWPLTPVSRDDVVRAMRQSLGLENAHVEIIDIAPRLVPAGELTFSMTGLLPAADPNNGPALWHGYIMYSGKRRFGISCRVRLSAPTTRVVAITTISAGRAIEASDVRLETVEDFPVLHEVARDLDDVVGLVARRGIPKGHTVFRTDVARPVEVEAGEIVQVDVESGRAHLALQARAENSGRMGDVISVRNPKSGKLFRARVEAKGKVLVMPGVTGGTVN